MYHLESKLPVLDFRVAFGTILINNIWNFFIYIKNPCSCTMDKAGIESTKVYKSWKLFGPAKIKI